MKEGYLPKDQRKKILFLCDDIRMHSGVATMAREIVVGTCHRYNWVNVGAAINHPEVGKKLDLRCTCCEYSYVLYRNLNQCIGQKCYGIKIAYMIVKIVDEIVLAKARRDIDGTYSA